jgi:hypothetical protein
MMMVMSIGAGSLFLIALEYLTGAVWSVPFRRVVEFVAAFLFAVPLFAIPVILNIEGVFNWTHSELVMNDEILSQKTPYLNIQFFIIRFLVILVLMSLFYFIFIRHSRKQDGTKEQILTKKNITTSAVFMPLFAISITIMAIDWLMSLEPHWYSTIFGVYYFSGTLLAALAVATFASITLNEKKYLIEGIISDHYYSLGALMFAFINFWAYIAFSQFMLIWYANLPEETSWFIARGQGSWFAFSIGLIIIHFVIPYSLLLSQPSKMDASRLKFAAVWILFAHYYDLYWMVMPNYSKDGIIFSWHEIAFPLFAVGLLIIVFHFVAKNQNLVPIGDPKLRRSLDFRL